MAGNIRNTLLKFLNFSGDDDYDDYDDYDEYTDDEYDEEPKRSLFGRRSAADEDDYEEAKPAKRMGKITAMHPKKGNNMELTVIRPTSFEDDGKRITDTLRDNCTVVLNLEGIDIDLAQRIVDFASGSCYAIDGNFKPISKTMIVITPPQVELSGDFMEEVNGSLNITNLEY